MDFKLAKKGLRVIAKTPIIGRGDTTGIITRVNNKKQCVSVHLDKFDFDVPYFWDITASWSGDRELEINKDHYIKSLLSQYYKEC
jgi:hypothetical protein